MKRVAILLLVVSSSACSLVNKGGARGPNIAHTQTTTQTTSDPSTGNVDIRTELAR